MVSISLAAAVTAALKSLSAEEMALGSTLGSAFLFCSLAFVSFLASFLSSTAFWAGSLASAFLSSAVFFPGSLVFLPSFLSSTAFLAGSLALISLGSAFFTGSLALLSFLSSTGFLSCSLALPDFAAVAFLSFAVSLGSSALRLDFLLSAAASATLAVLFWLKRVRFCRRFPSLWQLWL